ERRSAERRVASRETAEVDEPRVLIARALSDERRDARLGGRLLEGEQALESEDRVVEVRLARAIDERDAGSELRAEEAVDELGRVTQQARRQPRHLQHFEPRTHGTSPSSR